MVVRVKSHTRNIHTVSPTTERVRRGFKSTLVYSISGIPVRANIRLNRLSVENYYETPKIVMKDRDGRPVHIVTVDAATGKEIGVGIKTGPKYHRIYKNDKGRTVPSSELRYFQILPDGKEVEIARFESNIGAGKELKVEAVIPESEAERYLYESVYELNGDKDADDEVLFSIAKDMVKKKKVLVTTVVFRKGFKKSWGLISAEIGDNNFTMIMRVSRTKLQAISPMPIPTKKYVKVEKELPTVVWVKK